MYDWLLWFFIEIYTYIYSTFCFVFQVVPVDYLEAAAPPGEGLTSAVASAPTGGNELQETLPAASCLFFWGIIPYTCIYGFIYIYRDIGVCT